MKAKKIRKIIPMLAATPEYIINYNDIDYRAASLNTGRYNGYIAMPVEIWDKIKINIDDLEYEWYYTIPTEIEKPHGGWTYGEIIVDFSTDNRWIPLLDIRKVDTKNYVIFGFDTCHMGDNYEKWTAKTVREEVFRIYESIKTYVKNNF